MSLNDNFNRVYKKASARIRLLSSLRTNLDSKTASLVYKTMITPLILFNSIIKLNFTQTQLNKLTSLDNRAKFITKDCNIPSTINLVKRNACNIVHKSIYGLAYWNFHNYFEKLNHGKNTRNNKSLLRLPKIKLEVGRSSFSYMGARLFNDLPLNIRKLDTHQQFKREIREYLC